MQNLFDLESRNAACPYVVCAVASSASADAILNDL